MRDGEGNAERGPRTSDLGTREERRVKRHLQTVYLVEYHIGPRHTILVAHHAGQALTLGVAPIVVEYRPSPRGVEPKRHLLSAVCGYTKQHGLMHASAGSVAIPPECAHNNHLHSCHHL